MPNLLKERHMSNLTDTVNLQDIMHVKEMNEIIDFRGIYLRKNLKGILNLHDIKLFKVTPGIRIAIVTGDILNYLHIKHMNILVDTLNPLSTTHV